MSQEKIYPKGLFVNTPKQGTPEFVLGGLALTKEFFEWGLKNPQLFNEKGYLRLNLKKGKEEGKGYGEVDTYGLKATSTPKTEVQPLDDGLPF